MKRALREFQGAMKLESGIEDGRRDCGELT
jgi:hypothetical protein